MVTHESLFTTLQLLKSHGHNSLQIILTKETIKNLIDSELDWYDIKPGQEIKSLDMKFGEYRVYLGTQDKIQVIETEVWI